MRANHPLRCWRHKHRKSVEEFGRAIGVSKVTVSRYERGERYPSLLILRRIMLATDGEITAKDFMTPEAAE